MTPEASRFIGFIIGMSSETQEGGPTRFYFKSDSVFKNTYLQKNNELLHWEWNVGILQNNPYIKHVWIWMITYT